MVRTFSAQGVNCPTVMKTVRLLRSFLLLTITMAIGHGQQLAILDIAPVEIPETDALTLSEHFREVVSSKIGESIIPIEKVREVLLGDKVNNRWCAEEWCAREVGELLGVEKVIVSSIWKDGELYKLNGKLVAMEDTLLEKEHTFNFAGEEESLIPEVEVMAYELLSKQMPQELLLQHQYIDERSLALQGITEKKTRLTATLLSTAVPGLGQIYLKRKLWGGLWMATQLSLGAATLNQYLSYKDSYDEFYVFEDLYQASTDVDTIFAYRNEMLKTYDNTKTFIDQRKQLTQIIFSLWALNILQANIMSPSTEEILKDISIRFSHNPYNRQSQLRLTFTIE